MPLVTTTEMFKKGIRRRLRNWRFQCKQHGNHSGYHRGSEGSKRSLDSSGFRRRKESMQTILTL